jgi:hypothetical protein
VVRALLTGWIFRFGCPETITPDQGRQFESQLFHSLAGLCGIQLSWTTAHHPAANGLVERFHRTLKAAIMCHTDQQWTQALPLVLLGIRTSLKADLQASVAEIVYGEPLRIPSELLTPTADPVEPAYLITQLRHHMARLRPVPAADHVSSATFVHKDLHNCTCLSPSGRNTPGSGARLQWPLPGPLTDRENTAAPCARQACHRVYRQGQAGLCVEGGRLWEHHFQLLGQHNSSHSTTSSYTDYMLRSPRSLPRPLQHQPNSLGRGGGEVGTSQGSFIHISQPSSHVPPS